MTEKIDPKKLGDQVVKVLKTVYDPEIPVDIYELGLIYDVFLNESNDVKVLMTLTTPNCPVADSLPEEAEPLTLSINSKGEIFIQESKVEYEKIIAKVLAVSKNRTDTRIYVRGDKTINYGRVLEVMGTLSGAGFSKVALISEPYKN